MPDDNRYKLPMSTTSDSRERTVLLALVALDLVLSLWGFLFPEAWYRFFHASAYVDPQALLYRCAANWLAFFFIQLVALLSWRRAPWLLLLVAGCRLGDCLTDLTCLALCESISPYGAIAFPAAGIGNVWVGVWLVRSYLARK